MSSRHDERRRDASTTGTEPHRNPSCASPVPRPQFRFRRGRESFQLPNSYIIICWCPWMCTTIHCGSVCGGSSESAGGIRASDENETCWSHSSRRHERIEQDGRVETRLRLRRRRWWWRPIYLWTSGDSDCNSISLLIRYWLCSTRRWCDCLPTHPLTTSNIRGGYSTNFKSISTIKLNVVWSGSRNCRRERKKRGSLVRRGY